MATCIPQDLINESNAFLPYRGHENELLLALLCRINQALNPMATCDPQTLIQEGSVFLPYRGFENLLTLQLLCNIAASMNIVSCGTSDPVDPAPTGCHIYYRSDNGEAWVSVAQVWKKIIANA